MKCSGCHKEILQFSSPVVGMNGLTILDMEAQCLVSEYILLGLQMTTFSLWSHWLLSCHALRNLVAEWVLIELETSSLFL